MSRKATILVLGDPGPVRHELLIRSDIQTLWTNRAEELAALLRHSNPHVCLISAEIPLPQVQAALDRIDEAACTGFPPTPSIVLVGGRGCAEGIDETIAMRASAVVPAVRTESILALVGSHTGLVFARDPRATIEALVRAYIEGEEYILETSNISVSGVAIRNFPKISVGALVQIEIELAGGTIVAEARVVRHSDEGELPISGLCFVRIARAQRERIMKIVDAARKESERPDVRVEELFGDLTMDMGRAEALETSDIQTSSDLRTDDLDAERELRELEGWAKTRAWTRPPHDWMIELASELTELEKAHLRGQPARDWVPYALAMRVCLARSRHISRINPADSTTDLDPDGRPKLPSLVADEAYRVFVKLADCTRGECDAIVTQIAKIRAAMLRDLLAGGPKPRAGATTRLEAIGPSTAPDQANAFDWGVVFEVAQRA